MELLQTKDYFLRLNREQVHNTVENWQVNRANIEPESLPLYDSLFNDLLDQIRPQGLDFQITEDEEQPAVNEAEEALRLLDAMIGIMKAFNPQTMDQIKQALQYALRLRQMVKDET